MGKEGLPWWTLAAVLAAWSAGVMLGQLMSPLMPWLVAAGVVAGCAAVMRRTSVVLVGLAFVALIAGSWRGASSAPPQLATSVAGQDVQLTGQVDDDPVDRKTSRRLIVRVDQVAGVSAGLLGSLRVEATVYGMTPVHYGDLVLLGGVIEPPARFEQFDYRAYLAEQGIAAVMPSARLIRVSAHAGDPFHSALFRVRHGVINAIDAGLPEPEAALVLGVVFGYRAALPTRLQQQMIASGLIHIVVISGLKVSLLARIVDRVLGRWLPRAAPMVATAAMAGYALLAGASAAALRASAMGMLVLAAGRLRRESQVYVSMAVTAALMLAIKPALAGDVSFQLSFAGTFGIASMTDPVAARLRWMPGVVRDPFAATIAAELATWPMMLANFHQLSLLGPAANALVLPLLPVIMVSGGTGALLGGVIGALAWAPLQAAGLIATWFRLVIEIIGSLPFAAISMPYFPGRWFAAAAIVNSSALLGVKLRRFFWQQRVWAALGAAAIVVSVVLLTRPDGKVHVYALDVGTGSAVLIRTAAGHQILIDEGPDADRLAQAVGRALPPTARTVDLWLITSGRRTSIGAGSAALSRFQIGTIAVVEPDAWSFTLRSLVAQAQTAGVAVTTSNGPYSVDGVTMALAGDGRSWMVQTTTGQLVVVAPDTGWLSIPAGVDGAIFTAGGPTEWQGPGYGFSVIEVAANSRDGLPVRSVLLAMAGAPIERTDRLGTVELVAGTSGFQTGP